MSTPLEDAARRMLRHRCLWMETEEVGQRAKRDCESVLREPSPAPGAKGPAVRVRVNGSREEVWRGEAMKTRAGLRKEDLVEVRIPGRKPRIVSRRASEAARSRRGNFKKKLSGQSSSEQGPRHAAQQQQQQGDVPADDPR